MPVNGENALFVLIRELITEAVKRDRWIPGDLLLYQTLAGKKSWGILAKPVDENATDVEVQLFDPKTWEFYDIVTHFPAKFTQKIEHRRPVYEAKRKKKKKPTDKTKTLPYGGSISTALCFVSENRVQDRKKNHENKSTSPDHKRRVLTAASRSGGR